MSDRVLYEKVRTVLLHEWDPIGIKDLTEADDEYDAYVQPICEMLRAGKRVEDLCYYLHWLVTEYMLLDSDGSTERKIAEKLIHLSKLQ
ncbi:hypothetical protein [Lelliottia wanjuensis]|uniref:hypothetical protein n=1 Tax=Lelliottia wanjuensis TaxID=3050585 RepID=UPI00254BC7C0|nr:MULTISPECIES: hypothetical protein [unclassified Lelliottia]MDK9356114.1 hypothetical protein [Lelliottia sp. V106_16]MDK9375484.1 hypothetical protein [Lelliottia sp. V106_10]MDK9586889.1 hypothetical protein [Lelliottia sp. V86_10]MDK9601389.1 hypothetical protein [Lelliottia sp. V106_5]